MIKDKAMEIFLLIKKIIALTHTVLRLGLFACIIKTYLILIVILGRNCYKWVTIFPCVKGLTARLKSKLLFY